QIGRTTARSARRIASGNSWNTAGNPITLLTAIAACGPSTRLNTGTEINAAPNPTKPRNKPATVTATRTIPSRPSIGTPSSSDTDRRSPDPIASKKLGPQPDRCLPRGLNGTVAPDSL